MKSPLLLIVSLSGLAAAGTGLWLTSPLLGLCGVLAGGLVVGRQGTSGRNLAKIIAFLAIVTGFLTVIVSPYGFSLFRSGIHGGREPQDVLLQQKVDFSGLPGHLRKAMESNVSIIVDQSRLLGLQSDKYTGSGIVIASSDSGKLILTNRHVIDPGYKSTELIRARVKEIKINFCDGSSKEAVVWWLAPSDVDLAVLLTGSFFSEGDLEKPTQQKAAIGDRVFAIGNPHDLTWSYTEGVISGFRQSAGKHPVRILQTQTPINPGNSGGGLYSTEGSLLGIVTWTKEKSQAEGISFAIAYDDFLSLYFK